MSFIKLEADDGTVRIEAGGTVEELLAGWAAASVRFENLLRGRGVTNPEELLRVSLGFAEDRNKKGKQQ